MAIFTWRSSRRSFLAGGSVSSALAGLAPQRLLASLEGLTGTPAATANIYERLGVRTRINAKGTYTNLTGSLLPPEVARAMEDAAQHYVVLDELQRAVGERIARMLGVDRKSTRLNSSHGYISYAVFCLKKKKKENVTARDVIIS